ncbi:MAG: hypothetical protein ACPGVG_17545 [Mycobacterium sp.]
MLCLPNRRSFSRSGKWRFIADSDVVVFQALDTGTGMVTSWYVDMGNSHAGAIKFDEFMI